jgi:hypothetical protein
LAGFQHVLGRQPQHAGSRPRLTPADPESRLLRGPLDQAGFSGASVSMGNGGPGNSDQPALFLAGDAERTRVIRPEEASMERRQQSPPPSSSFKTGNSV